MFPTIRAKIAGTGSFAPPRRMSNAELESLVDTSDPWIRERTGIHERRIADDAIWSDRTTCVLFGDAAGAVVLEPSDPGSGILSTFMKSDGRMAEWLQVKVGGTKHPHTREFAWDGSDKIAMRGTDVFKVAVKEMGNACLHAIETAGVRPEDVSWVVPHQANMRIIEALTKRLGVSQDKVVVNVDRYGNTSAASVPLALDEANRDGRIKPGDLVLMTAFGGGLIWGAALTRW